MAGLLARFAVYAAILAIPCILVWQHKFIPVDDCLHHAAKSISGKPWNEILVMRDDIRFDPNPGWHALLSLAHRWSGCGPQALVIFSYASLLILLMMSVLPFFRRPEAWIVALTVAGVMMPDTFFFRLSRGRPYLLTEAFFLILLFLWRKTPGKSSLPLYLTTAGLLALSAWIHGSWYLWGIVPLAFLFLGEFAAAIRFGICLLVGSFLGAALTGHPLAYLGQQVDTVFLVFGSGTLPRLLVGELHPANGSGTYIVSLAVVWMLRRLLTDTRTADPDDRLLIMTGLLGWIGGLSISRWWSEWGLPATVLWMGLAIQQILETRLLLPRARQLVLVALTCTALVFAFVANRNERWTALVWESKNRPGLKTQEDTAWMPDAGGIVYNSQMTVFSLLFCQNPGGPWRYVYGFESGFMTSENLRILRDIQFNGGDWSAYRPWIERMTAADRLIVMCPEQPDIPSLDWIMFDKGLWSGRLPSPRP